MQLITCDIPKTAADEDRDALPLVVARLEQADLELAEIFAYTLYERDWES